MKSSEENRAALLMSISNVASRIVKLVELNAPNTILTNEVALLMMRAMTLAPEDMGRSLGLMLGGRLRVATGYCNACLSEIPFPKGSCSTCIFKGEMESLDCDEEEQLESDN